MDFAVEDNEEHKDKMDRNESEERMIYSFGIRYFYWPRYSNHKWYIYLDSKDNFMAFNEFYINPTYLGSPVPFQFEEI